METKYITQYPDCLDKRLTVLPTAKRLPITHPAEDQTVTIIKNSINWMQENPKTTIAIGIGLAVFGALILSSSDKNN